MGLFNLFKSANKESKSPQVVWRNASGAIVCPGNSCPQKCDMSCPIWCQTVAFQAMQFENNPQKAIDYFKQAIALAPDFRDAWNNMAAVYGGMNNHLEANKAYKTAYSLDRNYKNALFGLIVSCKNLGQFEEGLKYCDEFEAKFDKATADNLRKQIKDLQASGTVAKQLTAMEMATEIIAEARKDGVLGPNNHVPYIPELFVEAKRTTMVIFDDLIKSPEGQQPYVWLCWAAYAGMGAVQHWQTNWDELKKKGVAETLLEPRGSFAMDEYVTDIIGIGFKTPEGQRLSKQLFAYSMNAIEKYLPNMDEDDIQIAIPELLQSMYIFGMVYQMERLGMK